MEKSKIKIFTKILAIIIICLVSFVGIYVQRVNKMENILKDYKLGTELKGYREAAYEIKDGISDELKTEENYEKAKSIMESRLSDFGVENYNIGLDKKTGKIYMQLPENKDTDSVVTNVKETGKFEIKDSEDGTVLLDDSKIESAKVMYNSTEKGTIVYLRTQFNKEGASILKDLTGNTYAKIENTTEENTVAEEDKENSETENKTEENTTNEETENKQKQVVLSISGNDVTTTSFENAIENGAIDLSMNQATKDASELNEYMKSASIIATIINKGPLPVEYTVSQNQYVSSNISMNSIYMFLIAVVVIVGILLAVMIFKYKLRGLLSAICFIGFIAIYMLIIRYTNVLVSLATIMGMIFVVILNYIFNMNILKIDSDDKKEYNDCFVDYIMKNIPIFAMSIIFSFIKWAALNTIGMAVFWGIILMFVYNRFVTRKIVD